jgi:hypothetical protein
VVKDEPVEIVTLEDIQRAKAAASVPAPGSPAAGDAAPGNGVNDGTPGGGSGDG